MRPVLLEQALPQGQGPVRVRVPLLALVLEQVPEQLENERPDERTQFWDFRTSPPTPPPPSLPPRPPPVLFSEIDCADVCERVHALMQCTSDCCDEACRRDKRPGHGCEPDHCGVLKRRDAYFALKGG